MGANKERKSSTSDAATTAAEDEAAEDTSLSEDLSPSWPSKKHFARKARRKRSLSTQRRLRRPSTAVLKKPTVLDETLRDKIDMTMTNKEFLSALKLCKETTIAARKTQQELLTAPPSAASSVNQYPPRNKKAPVGFRHDPEAAKMPPRRSRSQKRSTSKPRRGSELSPSTVLRDIVSKPRAQDIYGSLKTKIPKKVAKQKVNSSKDDDDHKAAEEQRPGTTKVTRPINEEADLPHIQSRLRARRARITKKMAAEEKSAEVTTEKVPEPCRSCGRTDLPERFHTHHGHHHHHKGQPGAKEEGSKIPIRLASPPKRMTSLEDNQVNNKGKATAKAAGKKESGRKSRLQLSGLGESEAKGQLSPTRENHNRSFDKVTKRPIALISISSILLVCCFMHSAFKVTKVSVCQICQTTCLCSHHVNVATSDRKRPIIP